MPQATVHSSLVAEAWLAWHSMQRSMMWFLIISLNLRLLKLFTRLKVPDTFTGLRVLTKLPADGTVVDHNIPSPQCNSIPLLHLIQGSCEICLHAGMIGFLPQTASFLFRGLQRDLHLHWHHQPRGRCQHPSRFMLSEIYVGNFLERRRINDQP